MNKGTWSNDSEGWRLFWGRHRNAVILFGAVGILVAIWAVLVFLWYVGQAQSNGTVPTVLGLWSMSSLVSFLLNLIFWELILVGIPTIVALALAWRWWKALPVDERNEYRFFRKRSKVRNGGNGFSFVVFIVFCFKISADGNWNAPFAGWTFDYLVTSYLTAIVWLVIVIAIPAAIVAIWWFGFGSKSKG
ncbi:MAG: hypothetical protein A4E32_01616 [Methanomassiliicoccales archaeon PtaU1.Bin124]|nr:MAG: hypothetical protein A4E32_01616 [Methanomassiliicoccales archaeon PtaU1.Bin124]